ncbi:hypothetical protein EON68_03825, partial [archaeon]
QDGKTRVAQAVPPSPSPRAASGTSSEAQVWSDWLSTSWRSASSALGVASSSVTTTRLPAPAASAATAPRLDALSTTASAGAQLATSAAASAAAFAGRLVPGRLASMAGGSATGSGGASVAGSDWACGLTTAQRWQVGVLLGLGSLALWMMAIFVFLPLVAVVPSKFASAMTFASCLFIAAAACIRGPRSVLLGLCTRESLPITVGYVGSLALTLYATLVSQSYFLIIFALAVQIGALAWFASSFVPGGSAGMAVFTRLLMSSVTSTVRACVSMIVR